MDIIDIMLAKALTPQGQVETYAAKARKAAQDAAAAVESANTAASILEDAVQAKSDAENALATVQEALEALEGADSIDVEDVDAEVKKLTINTAVIDGQNAKTIQVISTYPDNTLNTQNVTKLYKNTGSNEDGAMTQKAITDALNNKADVSALNTKADKTYVDQKVASIPSGGGSGGGNTNLGSANSGKIVVVGSDGNIIAGAVSEEELIEALVTSGGYTARSAVGLEVDYDNKSFTRTQQAQGLTMGSSFDEYTMYGGRKRCNVADDGTINAFYGDDNYKDDGSNG